MVLVATSPLPLPGSSATLKGRHLVWGRCRARWAGPHTAATPHHVHCSNRERQLWQRQKQQVIKVRSHVRVLMGTRSVVPLARRSSNRKYIFILLKFPILGGSLWSVHQHNPHHPDLKIKVFPNSRLRQSHSTPLWVQTEPYWWAMTEPGVREHLPVYWVWLLYVFIALLSQLFGLQVYLLCYFNDWFDKKRIFLLQSFLKKEVEDHYSILHDTFSKSWLKCNWYLCVLISHIYFVLYKQIIIMKFIHCHKRNAIYNCPCQDPAGI